MEYLLTCPSVKGEVIELKRISNFYEKCNFRKNTNLCSTKCFWFLPIWGIQRENELEEWLSYMENEPEIDDDILNFIKEEQKNLMGEFCRGCGYCMPCPQGILINNCTNCGACKKKCPYSLDTPLLLQKNYADYIKVLSGEVEV